MTQYQKIGLLFQKDLFENLQDIPPADDFFRSHSVGHEDRTFFEKTLFKGSVEDHVEELKKQTGAEVTVIR